MSQEFKQLALRNVKINFASGLKHFLKFQL